ncbi:MAG: hypothetical protein LC772_05970 [Chloroflexi bacterium]|nr:hypothetical protein [Chloroflexota bacterium]
MFHGRMVVSDTSLWSRRSAGFHDCGAVSIPVSEEGRHLEHSQQHITTVTPGEIVFGAHRSIRPSYHLQRLRD